MQVSESSHPSQHLNGNRRSVSRAEHSFNQCTIGLTTCNSWPIHLLSVQCCQSVARFSDSRVTPHGAHSRQEEDSGHVGARRRGEAPRHARDMARRDCSLHQHFFVSVHHCDQLPYLVVYNHHIVRDKPKCCGCNIWWIWRSVLANHYLFKEQTRQEQRAGCQRVNTFDKNNTGRPRGHT